MTPSHELFHAIQAGYDPVTAADAGGECTDWIMEGSATALEVVMSEGAAHPPYSRYYDDALYEPPGACEPNDEYYEWAYGTYDFWLFAGAKLGSAGRIKYFHEIFQQFLNIDNGVWGVNVGLQAAGASSLAQVYTDFVTEELTINKQCHFRPLGELVSGNCKRKGSDEFRISLEVTEAEPKVEEGRAVDTKKFATSAFVVRTKVPENRVGGLVVEIPEPAEDQWRLVVDGRRFDKPDPLTRTRNRTMVVVPGGTDSVFVRVVHAPDDPAYSPGRPTELLELELTLLEGCSPEDMLSALDPELAFGESSGDATAYGAPQYMPEETLKRGATEAKSSQTRGLLGRVLGNLRGVDRGVREADPAEMSTAQAGLSVRRLLPPDEYQAQFEPYPEMHPAPGFLRIAGWSRTRAWAAPVPSAPTRSSRREIRPSPWRRWRSGCPPCRPRR